MPNSQSWLAAHDSSPTGDDSQTLYTRWMNYILAESIRLCLYSVVFLDSTTFSSCNSRPLMSPMELGWELPYSVNLWEARNSQLWLQRMNESFGYPAYNMGTNVFNFPRGLETASLSKATQALMGETPSSELLASLEASPLATFFVLANFGSLIRDFTRCYYQMPPTPSDPNAFHILTQFQNKQIHTAIRAISKIVKDQAYTSESPKFFLWRTIDLFISSIRVTLCRPDQLLIGGIVDNSLIAGMAASTHLTQGNYVAIRRSVPILPEQIGGDQGIVTLLNDLSGALQCIFGEDYEHVNFEAPWTTVVSYGILLCIWGALKRAIADIRQHLNAFNELPRRSESSMLIFNTLIESVILNFPGERAKQSQDPRLWSTDQGAFVTLLEDAEPFFVSMVKTFCRQRQIWGIGTFMLNVLGEIAELDPTCTRSG